MVQQTPGSIAHTTLTEVFAPVARYEAALKAADWPIDDAAVALRALDVGLMHLWATMSEPRPRLIDLAASATQGRSTVLWNALGFEVPPSTVPAGWVATLNRFLRDDLGAQGQTPVLPGWEAEPSAPVLACLAASPGDPAETIARLDALYADHPRAVTLLLPLGLLGQEPALGPLLRWAEVGGLRLVALRDLAPALGTSRLALLAPADDDAVPRRLGRLRQFFTTNFDMLALAQRNFTMGSTHGRLEDKLKKAQDQLADAEKRAKFWEKNHHTLEGLFDQLQEWGRGVETQADECRGWAYQMEVVVRQHEVWNRELHETIASLEHQRGEAERSAAGLREELRQVESRVAEITGGRGWAVVKSLSSIKSRLLSHAPHARHLRRAFRRPADAVRSR